MVSLIDIAGPLFKQYGVLSLLTIFAIGLAGTALYKINGHESACVDRAKQRVEQETKVADGIEYLTIELKQANAMLSKVDEDGHSGRVAIHGRIDDINTRLGRIEGRVDGIFENKA